MAFLSGPYRNPAILILVNAVLNAVAIAYAGMSGTALLLALLIAIYGLLIFGLSRGWRSAAWLGFFTVAISGIVALAQVWSTGTVPAVLWISIALVSLVATLLLFGRLWATAPEAPTG